jgi:GNAT superfamily N-acetyltransferase
MATHEVRTATYADVPELARVLAAAFDDDPVFGVLFPVGTRRRQERITRLFALTLGVTYLGHDATWTTADRAGAAVWAPPNRWKTPTRQVVRHLPALLGVLGLRVPAALRMLSTVEKVHPPGPHWTLAVLGTDPSRQGKGVGAEVLAPVLDHCDEQGTGAYLESSKEKNIPYYRRFGFEVTQEIPLPVGDVRAWGMWRDPR